MYVGHGVLGELGRPARGDGVLAGGGGDELDDRELYLGPTVTALAGAGRAPAIIQMPDGEEHKTGCGRRRAVGRDRSARGHPPRRRGRARRRGRRRPRRLRRGDVPARRRVRAGPDHAARADRRRDRRQDRHQSRGRQEPARCLQAAARRAVRRETLATCRAASSSPGSPRSSRPGSSSTRRSSPSSRPTRRLRPTGPARCCRAGRAARSGEGARRRRGPERVPPAGDPQLRPHPRPRDRAPRGLSLAPRQGRHRRHDVSPPSWRRRRPARRATVDRHRAVLASVGLPMRYVPGSTTSWWRRCTATRRRGGHAAVRGARRRRSAGALVGPDEAVLARPTRTSS